MRDQDPDESQAQQDDPEQGEVNQGAGQEQDVPRDDSIGYGGENTRGEAEYDDDDQRSTPY